MLGHIAACARLVSAAERPSPISARDGMLLRLVAPRERMSPQQLQQALLRAAGLEDPEEPDAAASGSQVSS